MMKRYITPHGIREEHICADMALVARARMRHELKMLMHSKRFTIHSWETPDRRIHLEARVK